MPFDTTGEALEVQRAVWRGAGPEGRVRIAFELPETALRVTLAGIAAQRPDLSAAEHVEILVRADLPTSPRPPSPG